MSNVIHHNPRCTKSRQTLSLLEKKGVAIKVNEYLESPPSAKELKEICKKLGVKPLAITRTKENLFKDLDLSVKDERTDDQWIKILHNHPKLIERPIVLYKGKVAIGRPPENVLKII